MNDKLLYSYALTKTIHEQRKDYIDTFCPFVLKVLPTKGDILTLIQIQKKIEENYGLNIPEHSLKSIITRAKGNGYINLEKWQVRLSEKGNKYLDHLEPENEVERRINELLEDIRLYLNETKFPLEEIYKIVLCFINANISLIVEFFDPTRISKLDISKSKIINYEDKLIQYFVDAEKQKPQFWKTLQDIVYGSVISVSVISSKIAEINKKFQDVQVFLDSNFIFSLFEFHFPEVNKPAKELYELLKIYKFQLKVFDFTLYEIVNVLNNYSQEQHMYVSNVKVNSIYSNLKCHGWTVDDVREFIQKIEEKIWSLNIVIEPTNVDLMTYLPRHKEYINVVLKCKPIFPHQNERAHYHDIAAIETIEEIRGSPKREIERSKAIFLTSDLRLSRCNFFEMGHKEKATICEVIPDRLLTNILWLKNPTLVRDIPLKLIIAIHSREIFIDKKIWRRFYEVAKKLKEEGRITDKDLSMLFYNHHIEKILSSLDESEIEEVKPDLILEEIQKISSGIDSETQRKLEEQKKIFEDELAKKDLEKEKNWSRRIEKLKLAIKIRSERCSKFLANVGSWIIATIVAFLLFFCLPSASQHYPKVRAYLEQARFYISVLSLFGIKFSLRKMRRNTQVAIFNFLYKRELRELKLN